MFHASDVNNNGRFETVLTRRINAASFAVVTPKFENIRVPVEDDVKSGIGRVGGGGIDVQPPTFFFQ